jgi:hypothetical protein
MIGKGWFDTCLPQPEGRDLVYPNFLAITAGGIAAVEYFENAILTGGGEVRQIAWHNALLRDDDGRIVGTLSSGQDITERIRADARVADQLAELRRWHDVMLDREDRVLELKREVNTLCRRFGEPDRYLRDGDGGAARAAGGTP